jgi:drug/metabolite transporter (DMT)-like permease
MAVNLEARAREPVQAPLAGVLWMVVAAVFFAVSVGLVRHIAETINAFEQTFWRQFIGLILILPFLLRKGLPAFRTRQLKTNLLRALVGYAGISLAFYSVTLIPLADALALQFTLPLFTIVFAMLILGEKVGIHRWAATVIGFTGALISRCDVHDGVDLRGTPPGGGCAGTPHHSCPRDAQWPQPRVVWAR